MKKLYLSLFLSIITVVLCGLKAQSYYVQDQENSILLGSPIDTTGIFKNSICKVWYSNGYVELISETGYVLGRLQPNDFGYTDPYLLRRHLHGMAHKEYINKFTHNSAGNVDTVYNLVGTDTLSYVLYGYDANDTLISRQFLSW